MTSKTLDALIIELDETRSLVFGLDPTTKTTSPLQSIISVVVSSAGTGDGEGDGNTWAAILMLRRNDMILSTDDDIDGERSRNLILKSVGVVQVRD